jgi:hypothetical protein
MTAFYKKAALSLAGTLISLSCLFTARATQGQTTTLPEISYKHITDNEHPPSALAILSRVYDILDDLDPQKAGFNLLKSFKLLLKNLDDEQHKNKLQAFSKNSSWLSDAPYQQVHSTARKIRYAPDFLIIYRLNRWIHQDLENDSGLSTTVKQALKDHQITKAEFVHIISDYGHEKFNHDGPRTLSDDYMDTAYLFAKMMDIKNPSEHLLRGLALFEAEGTRAKSRNIGDVYTLKLGAIKP